LEYHAAITKIDLLQIIHTAGQIFYHPVLGKLSNSRDLIILGLVLRGPSETREQVRRQGDESLLGKPSGHIFDMVHQSLVFMNYDHRP